MDRVGREEIYGRFKMVEKEKGVNCGMDDEKDSRMLWAYKKNVRRENGKKGITSTVHGIVRKDRSLTSLKGSGIALERNHEWETK